MTTTSPDSGLTAAFQAEAGRLDDIHNMFYLAEYSDGLAKAYRQSAREAKTPETKQGLAASLAEVIVVIGTGSADQRGISNTLSTMAEMSAAKKLSGALFKHTAPGDLPADFAGRMNLLSRSFAQLADTQHPIVASLLKEKAGMLAKIGKQAEEAATPRAPRKGLMAGLLTRWHRG